MKCDRLIRDLSGKELQSIESQLPRSEVPFLKPDQHFKDILAADEATLKKHGLDLPSMIGKIDLLLSSARAAIQPYEDDEPSKLAGCLQYVNDRANNLARAMESVFKSDRASGLTVVNCGAPPDASMWEGPNPFAMIPINPEWSCWERMQAPVVVGDRVYIVATVTWGGAQKVSGSAVQHNSRGYTTNACSDTLRMQCSALFSILTTMDTMDTSMAVTIM